MEYCRRSAITRRIALCGTKREPASAITAEPAAAGAVTPRATASSISARIIRPCGPVPINAAKSIPLSPAMRRASGLAKIRFADGTAADDGVETGIVTAVPTGTGAEIGAETGAGATDCCAESTGAAAALTGSAFGTDSDAGSSPSSARTAITVFTATFWLPSATMNFAIIPSSSASTSIVALSVSISAITSPDRTASPSATTHLARVPSVIVGDSAGIRIFTAILHSF